MKVLILGVNGFIGHHLTARILSETEWKVYGMDLSAERLGGMVDHTRFEFVEGDISINKEWIEYHIKKADVVLPLVAIATPKVYVERPLSVFELDFEENLRIVRQAHRYGKRVVFPSTSEVYGMCTDAEFDEETSPLVLGPILKERWIYSCSKQLLDRVIWAYGRHGLSFTLFRPFNWIGPRLDSIETAKEGSSRVVTQFIANLFMGEPIQLVDGGRQRRCFTYVDDGISALMNILENRNGCAAGKIFNVGNPKNDCSIRDLAHQLRDLYSRHPGARKRIPEIVEVDSKQFYGEGYQDIQTRTPSIERARQCLGWSPKVGLREALAKTLDAFLEENEPPKRRRGRGSPAVAGRGHS
jgi:nucleoside-diphosphate-sugar epimerase